MYCTLRVNNGSIVIYYGKSGLLRFPTGVKISKTKDRKNKFKDWDYKNHVIRQHVYNSVDLNEIIQRWLTNSNKILSEYLKQDILLTAEELKIELISLKNSKTQTDSNLFLPHFIDFMNRKRIQLVERDSKSDVSFVTYGTFKSTIEDFEFDHNIKLKIQDVTNHTWLSDFHTWLTSERRKIAINLDGITYKFKTKGNLKPSSVNKRFSVLSGYFSYLKEIGLITDDSLLKNYKRTEITIPKKVKTTLLIDEIHSLYEYKFNDIAKEKVKLLFLFSCLTGFRWKDIEEFDKNFITEIKGRKVYKHIASKTRYSGKVATIPFCDLAIKILEELNFKLNIFSNGYTNRLLHKLLEETELFNQTTFAMDNLTGRKLHRYELLSMHRGRDTFITNLISTVPLNELMSYTSHEKLSTLQTYIDSSRDINPEYVTIFDKNV